MTALRARVEAFVTGIAAEQRQIAQSVMDLASPLFKEVEVYLAPPELKESIVPMVNVLSTGDDLLESLKWLVEVIDTVLAKDFPESRYYDNEREGTKYQLSGVREEIMSDEGYVSRIREHLLAASGRVPF